MDGMTEEQKEYEAMKLVDMFNKLSRLISAEQTHDTRAAQYEQIYSNILKIFYKDMILIPVVFELPPKSHF